MNETDKVFDLLTRSWLTGDHELGKTLLAAYGEKRQAQGYQEGVKAMRDAATGKLQDKHEASWAEVIECIAVRLLEGAPK